MRQWNFMIFGIPVDKLYKATNEMVLTL